MERLKGFDLFLRLRNVFLLLSCCILILQSCNSDKDDFKKDNGVIIEEYSYHLREMIRRYNLPEELLFYDAYFMPVSKFVMSIGYDDNYNMSVIVCDTTINESVYVNLQQIKMPNEISVSLPYGECANLRFLRFSGIRDIVSDGEYVAATVDAWYNNDYVYLLKNYRFFYKNGELSVAEVPIKNVYKDYEDNIQYSEKVMMWYGNHLLFWSCWDYGSRYSRRIACYDDAFNLCFENDDICDYSGLKLYNAQIIQAYDIDKGIGIECSGYGFEVFSQNIVTSEILWSKKHIEIGGYEYKDDDRVSVKFKSFENNVLYFYVDVISYSGEKYSFVAGVSTGGDVENLN
ncbi:MAG: hypothetical protein K2L41_07925 [Muribaculaceae bacterium]|nr:hypothetical protein [Muribaculaceae bacterium]